MSTMPATHGHSAACCNIPPIVSEGYQKKGSFQELGSHNTYVTGPADADKGIIVIFDIFGFFDQTVQGADILATSDDHQKYKVLMPDWFDGDAAPIEWYPPDTEEKQKKLGAWFGAHGPQTTAAELPEYLKAVQAKNPSIKSWGLLGFCWGGKVVNLVTSAETNPFKAGGAVHPAFVDHKDAAGIKVPTLLLASKDESAEEVKKYEAALTVPHHVETFKDQIHGWMAARSDLKDPRVKEEYERGYKTVLSFFGKHL